MGGRSESEEHTAISAFLSSVSIYLSISSYITCSTQTTHFSFIFNYLINFLFYRSLSHMCICLLDVGFLLVIKLHK